MVIEPIFESDFEKCSYGFRPKKRAAGAIEEIKIHLKNGKTEVLDADLSAYFDTIPHDKLMKTVGKRISDKYVLNLIKMWLKAPISENGILKKSTIGTPQGGVISPLLANIYLDILDKVIKDK
jgi:retron-type reverse transcriptase